MRSFIAALALTLSFTALSAAAANPAESMLGQPAPPFSLTDVVSGETITLAELRGSVVVLHFCSELVSVLQRRGAAPPGALGDLR